MSIDVATFYDEYDGLIDFTRHSAAFEPAPQPHVEVSAQAQNSLSGASYGAELSLDWSATDQLRFDTDYSWLHLRVLDGSHEFERPESMAHLRAHRALPKHMERSGALGYVDRLRNAGVDSYVDCGLGVIWQPVDSMEVGFWGRNLLDRNRVEFADFQGIRTAVGRSAGLTLRRRFWPCHRHG